MTICCECGQDKTSYHQGTLGRVLAWKCHECTYKYKKIEFQSIEDEMRGIYTLKEDGNGIITDNKQRKLLKENDVKYWIVDE